MVGREMRPPFLECKRDFAGLRSATYPLPGLRGTDRGAPRTARLLALLRVPAAAGSTRSGGRRVVRASDRHGAHRLLARLSGLQTAAFEKTASCGRASVDPDIHEFARPPMTSTPPRGLTREPP